MFRHLIFSLLFFLAFNWSLADEHVIYSNEVKYTLLGEYVYVLKKDKTGQYKFIKNSKKVVNLGVSKASHWLKISIKNISNDEHLFLQIAQPTLDELKFYEIRQDSILPPLIMGDNYPFENRLYKDPNYIIDIQIPKNSVKTFILNVKSGEQIILPISVGNFSENLIDKVSQRNIIFGIYCGIILVMFFYNLFIYFSIRDKSYLYYVLHTLLVGLTQASFHGLAFQYLWPDSPWIANQSIFIFTCLVSIVGIEFMKNFILTRYYTPIFHKILYVFTVIYSICILLSIVGEFSISYKLIQFTQVAVTIAILLIVMVISSKGYRPAKFYLLAWTIFMVGIFIFALKDFGILPYNNFTNYTMIAGSSIELILLSFALADKINIFRREKEEAQQNELEQRIEKQQILEKQTETLKYEVEIATRELRETQMQLIQSEKMASLGQLTAGIAHEINNPINFVRTNVRPLKRDINRLYQLIDKYEGINSSQGLEDQLKSIAVFKEEIESDLLKEEVTALLSGIDDGASRTLNIVEGLKSFSRLGNTSFQEYDITTGIESCLTILHHRISLSDVYVQKNYKLPVIIKCLPDRINQVFMNILDNAIDALSNEKGEKRITIDIKKIDNTIKISIADNGVGISNEIQKKIFDPFYTTKDIGSGTGLGLSIAYGIIKDHKGDIHVVSHKGKGTTFIIILNTKLNETENNLY